MKIPISSPTIVTIAKPRNVPSAINASASIATMVVVAETNIIPNANEIRFRYMLVEDLPPESTSSVIITNWSTPVPITAIIPAMLARSNCHFPAERINADTMNNTAIPAVQSATG